MENSGKIYSISGPVVIATDLDGKMFDVVKVGELGLIGEIIKIVGKKYTIQVYEDTSGLKPGEPVKSTSKPLSVELGPGLLKSIYDGIQRPLDIIRSETGDFIIRGASAPPLDENREWEFTPLLNEGAEVKQGYIVGTVQETDLIVNKIMVPHNISGKIKSIKSGKFKVSDTVCIVENNNKNYEIKLKQTWPVREARRVFLKFAPEIPLITGQRIIDSFFPVAKGGTVAVPGPFGSGKCVTGDTPVLLGNGSIKYIRDLYEEGMQDGIVVQSDNEEYIHLRKPIELLSFNNGKIQKSESTLLYKGKSDSVIRVRTRTGREVRVTPVHKLFKLTEKGVIEEIEAKHLSPGDYIVSAKYTGIDGKNSPIDVYAMDEARVLDRNIRDRVASLLKLSYDRGIDMSLSAEVKYSLSRSYNRATPKLSWIKEIFTKMGEPLPRPHMLVGDRRSTPVHVPDRMSDELAEFLGFYISEGYIRGNETIVFTNQDEKLLQRYTYLAERLFSLRGIRETQKERVPNILLHSKILVEFLNYLNTGKIASTKMIPDILLSSSSSAISAFLTSYFIGDGSFYKNSVEFSTASRWLSIQISYLLTRFGIMNTQGVRRIGGKEHYRIFVRGKESITGLLHVMKPGHAKIDKMQAYLRTEKSTYNSIDIVPVSSGFIKDIYSKYTRYSDLQREGIEIYNYTGNKKHIGSEAFKKFSTVIEGSNEYQMLETPTLTLADSLEYIYFDRIVSTEEESGPFDVYDVSVPESGKNFVGGYGGIILHNTVIQHQLSKWSDADITVYVGCGERGNEMTEILSTFPELLDPKSSKPLMEKTILIANTSNMPVAAREASIYTGVTVAEYYRDMGYDVALMADSTSRWAEALREISGRLEEMPGEEGYPAYLGRRVSEFYERSGRAQIIPEDDRIGSITLIGAVSPPGGDLSDPVVQNTLRVTRVFWALDASLASRRHFPSINWLNSYSLYLDSLSNWFKTNVNGDWLNTHSFMMGMLQKESELQEIVQLVGYDSLPEKQKNILDIAQIIREDVLQQNAFDDIDTYCSMKKQYEMLMIIKTLNDNQEKVIDAGRKVSQTSTLPVRSKISRMKEVKEEDFEKFYNNIIKEINDEYNSIIEGVENV